MYFSVIVTIYKVEPYLEACIDSVLSQTFEDFELILVNDASPDRCPLICNSYAKRDRRVRVIHQENGGTANARKAGLLVSAGRYVTFVDGDDWIAPRFLERGYELLETTGTEMLSFACAHVYHDRTEKAYEPVPEGLYGRKEIRERVFPCLLMDLEMRHMFYYAWGKIFLRSLAVRNFMAVDSRLSFGEDMLCIVPAYAGTRSVCVSREVMSFYRVREQSGAHGFRPDRYRQLELALEGLQELQGRTTELPEDFDGQTQRYGAYICFTLMVYCVNEGQYGQLGEMRQRMSHPLLQRCIRQAKWKGIGPKARVTLWLLKWNMTTASYLFLWGCQRIRRIRDGRRDH